MTLPFDFSSGELVVSASINGGPPRRFIIDSGAGMSVLLPSVAKELKLEPKGELNAGAGPHGIHLAIVPSMGDSTAEIVLRALVIFKFHPQEASVVTGFCRVHPAIDRGRSVGAVRRGCNPLMRMAPPNDSAVTRSFVLGSVVVSYARARAEVLNLDCEVGLMARPERIIVLAVGLILAQATREVALTVILAALCLSTYYTVAQRIIYVYRETRGTHQGAKS